MPKALILGASGQLGFAVADQLARDGWQVHAATRGHRALPQPLHGRATLMDGEARSLADLLAESGPVDALFDPNAYDAADAQALLAQKARYGSLVVISSASVYCDAAGNSLETETSPDFPLPLAESQTTVAPGPDTYSSRKITMEQVVRDANFPATILRPCAIHGLYARHPREWWLVKRALDGRAAIPVSFGAQSRFHTTAAVNLAALTALCLEAPGQRVLNVADPVAHSVAEIAATLALHLGQPVPLMPFAGPPQGSVGKTPWSLPDRMAVDCSAARALGWQPQGYRETTSPLVEWMLAATGKADWRSQFPVFGAYGHDPFDYAAEDAWLAAWG